MNLWSLPQRATAVLCVICCAVFLTSSAGADVFAKATGAHEAGQFATAIKLLGPLAKAGNPRAQHLLGKAWERADGRSNVMRDKRKALLWYERAAKQGYLPAGRSLGRVLAGDAIDVRRGHRILLKLAKNGDVGAQAFLGTFMLRKDNPSMSKKYHLPGTVEEGLSWLHRAANKKNTLAAWRLMHWYRDQGKHRDGYFWDIVTAALFERPGPMITPPIRARLSSKQRADVERRAAAWLRERAVEPATGAKSK